MAEALLETHDLAKTYASGWGWMRRTTAALRGVSLRVEAGEIVGLLGPNGAGKTTFIKTALGMLRASGGSAALLGRPAGDVSVRARLGFLPERLRLPGHQTAAGCLEFFAALGGLPSATARKRIPALLDEVGLESKARERVQSFSKGMLQRLGLAQALLAEPALLILDEPTDGIDPAGRHLVRELLRRRAEQGMGILLNSHILQEVELVSDRVAILHRGILRACGRLAELAGDAAGVVELEFRGPASAWDAAAVDWKDVSVEPQSEGWIAVEGRPADQAALDAAVDSLRAAGCSLRRLEWRKPSLETFFLACIAAAEPQPAAPSALEPATVSASIAAAPSGPVAESP